MEDRLAEALNLAPGGRVLDAGCGDGYVAMYLTASRGWLVEGIEINKHHVMKTRKNFAAAGIPGDAVREMDYHNMADIQDETYDAVYTTETLMHVVSLKQALSEIFRIPKPGGKMTLHEYEHLFFATDEELVTMKDGAEKVAAKVELQKLAAMVAVYGGAPTYLQMGPGFWSSNLRDVGFEINQDLDFSEQIKPLLYFSYILAFVPYYLVIRPLGLERHFPNTLTTVFGWWTASLNMQSYHQVIAWKPAVAEWKLCPSMADWLGPPRVIKYGR